VYITKAKAVLCPTVGRPKRRWDDNIKLDLKDIEYVGEDRINLD
jgi:hypothetical protein